MPVQAKISLVHISDFVNLHIHKAFRKTAQALFSAKITDLHGIKLVALLLANFMNH